MVRRAMWVFLAVLSTAALCACDGSLSQGQSGSIAMMPLHDQERGLAGILPATCQRIQVGTWLCEDLIEDGPMLISQHALPLSRDELVTELLADTDIKSPPEAYDTMAIKGLEWQLFSFEASIADIAQLLPGPLHIEMALAERDGVVYMVGVTESQEAYAESADLCDSLFTHLVYNLRPWAGPSQEGRDG